MRLRVSTGWAVTVLLAAVGCGQTSGTTDAGSGAGSGGGADEPPVMGLEFAQSGSRVLALGYSSNEARLFRTFHDQELGFDCEFVSDAAGGDQRCVPTAKVTMVYTDASCTEPATWADGGQQRELAVGQAVSGGLTVETTCPGDAPTHRDAYRVGERLREESFGPANGLFQVSGGGCQTASPPAKIFPAVVRLIQIPETELARGRRSSVDVGAGLRLTRLLADDGAQLTLGVTGADGTPCELQRDGECVPEPIARPASLMSDKFYTALNAECSAPAFHMPYDTACGIPKFGLAYDDAAQPLRIQAMAPAAEVFGLDLVVPVTDPVSYSCTRKDVSAYGWVAAPGQDMTGTLPTASRLRRGTGPLHVDWFSAAGRELLPVSRRESWGAVVQGRFTDADDRSCDVLPAEDGTLRCVFDDERGANPLTSFPEVVAFTY